MLDTEVLKLLFRVQVMLWMFLSFSVQVLFVLEHI